MPSSAEAEPVQFDTAKIDNAVLALLHLNTWVERCGEGPTALSTTIAWKSLNWDALDRLHAAGLISEPRKKAKSVTLTPEGAQRAADACRELFG